MLWFMLAVGYYPLSYLYSDLVISGNDFLWGYVMLGYDMGYAVLYQCVFACFP